MGKTPQDQLDRSNKYYKENRLARIEYTKQYKKRNKVKDAIYLKERRAKRKTDLVELMGNQCAHCKGSYHTCVYDFHHLDPSNKRERASNLLTLKWETVLEEVKKCILLCANCHRLAHYG